MLVQNKKILKYIENILMNYTNCRLHEAVRISAPILKILNDFEILVPEDIPKINKIDLSDIDETQLKINDKTYMKIAKVIQKIKPNISDTDLKKIINKIKQEFIKINKHKYNKYHFKIFKDVKKWYNLCNENILSCMSDKLNLIEFYDKIDDISILVLFDDDNKETPIGRALLWKNVDGAKEYFMDRVYPAENVNVVNLYQAHADENDWSYRDNEHSNKIINGNNVLTYHIKNDISDVELLPFVDTLKYISIENNIMTNSFKNKQLGTGYLIADKTEGTYTNKYQPIIDFLYKKNNKIKSFQELKKSLLFQIDEVNFAQDYHIVDSEILDNNLFIKFSENSFKGNINKILFKILTKKIDIKSLINPDFLKESNLYKLFIELLDNSKILKNNIKTICNISNTDKSSLDNCSININEILNILGNTICDIIDKQLYEIVYNEWSETISNKYGIISEEYPDEILIDLWKHSDKLKNAINNMTFDFLLITFEDIWEETDISIIDVPIKRLESKYNEILDEVQNLDMNEVIIAFISNLKHI